MSVLPKGLAVEVAARAAWSRVAEPGDRQAVALVDRLGAVDALAAVVEGHDWVPEALRVRAAGVDLEGLVQFAFRRGWRMVVPGADEWPTGVDALDVPPIGLWVAGPVDLASISARSVAVVGARACTAYGMGVAAELGAGLLLKPGQFNADSVRIRAAQIMGDARFKTAAQRMGDTLRAAGGAVKAADEVEALLQNG